MERLQDVTLTQAYEYVRKRSFGLWKVKGNYMKVEIPISGENVETLMFLGESIFILALSVEKEGFNVMASRADFIDIWPSVKAKYPELFEENVKGELCLIP